MPKARHFAPPLLVLFLGCTVLTSGAQAGWFDFGSDKPATKPAQPEAKEKATGPATPAANLEDSIRQAQMLRLAGNYDEAIKHLSQLMMVAADDPRVVTEYGKTLAQMGRASDAVNFLTRASQLSSTDWTVYSALGVAYDEVGNQKAAQAAYEHALVLNPGESSVLNNYALSRLLAKDTDMARSLAGRAEIANATHDDKITRNIAMIRSMAPAPSVAVNKPVPQAAPVPNFTPVAQQALPHALSVQKVAQTPLPAPAPAKPVTPDNRVVMQRVPVDPLAGPVASHAPRPLQPLAKAEAPKPEAAKTETAKAEPAKPETAKALPAKPVPAKTEVAVKPAAKPEAKAEAAKPAAKPEVAKAEAAKPGVKIDLAAAKPEAKTAAKTPEPKVLPPAPVKAASVKPAPAKDAKADAKADSKNAIPGLRLSANAF